MKRIFLYLLPALMALTGLTACEENLDETPERADWAERNAAYFHERLTEAKDAIARAKAAYGDEWTDHCPWRVMRTYVLTDSATATETDTICVRILQSGTGTVRPLYTDKVSVNYIGRLIPDVYSTDTESRTTGYVFDHTGTQKDSLSVFSPQLASPGSLSVSNTVEGFTTAIQHMKQGDLWRIYIPSDMGYGAVDYSSIPGGSTLVFDLQLCGITHIGQ